MKWLELSVQAPSEYVEPLSEVFHRYGHGGVAIERKGGHNPDEWELIPTVDCVTVKTYIPLDASTDERRNYIDLGVRLVAHLAPISGLEQKVIEQEEWENAWKRHFHTLHIGERIVIVPSWRNHMPDESDIVIELDPGMAFGTGYHPTTRMCLEILDKLIKPDTQILDVGCGSGILSIAAAKLGATSVLGLEVDTVAFKVAKANVLRNGVAETVKIVLGTLPRSDVQTNSYDIVVANISAKVAVELARDLVAVVEPGGTLVISGVLMKNKDTVVQRVLEEGALVECSVIDGDWVSLVVSLPRAARV